MPSPARQSKLPLRRAIALAALALAWWGCSATTRHRVLSTLFDGVPPPKASAAADAVADAAGVSAESHRAAGRVQHEPYASGACDSCHDARVTNRLVAPARELCFQCHDFAPERRFVHGPLAAGGCLLCHDPHESPNRFLLVDASDGFCLRCHDAAELRPVPGHEAGRADCTACHEAHMSDRRFLLRQ